MSKFTDEVKELHEIYQYMRKEGFNDGQFIRAAEDLVQNKTYSAKALDIMKTVHGISDGTVSAKSLNINVTTSKKQSVADAINKINIPNTKTKRTQRTTNSEPDPCASLGHKSCPCE